MSGLLIGLIGVALFTAILLYGGVVFGPRIQEGAQTGNLTNLLLDMSQAANTTNRYRLSREVAAGADLGTLSGLVNAGYLPAVPTNPVVPAKAPELADSTGHTYAKYLADGIDPATFSPAYVVTSLGTDNLACSLFARQTGQISRTAEVSTASTAFAGASTAQAGCVRVNSASGNIANGDFVAYVRL